MQLLFAGCVQQQQWQGAAVTAGTAWQRRGTQRRSYHLNRAVSALNLEAKRC